MSYLELSLVQRTLVWLLLAAIVLFIAFMSATRLLARTNDDRNPTIVGALVLKRADEVLGSLPLYTYVGDVYTKTAVLGVMTNGGPAAATIRVLFSNIVADSCQAQNASVINGPREIGIDTALYSFHQGFQRKIYAVDLAIAANAKAASVSCNVMDPPERETYTTRRMAFAPPLNPDILAEAGSGGFSPILPVMASIQRVTESTGFITLGGQAVHDNTYGAIVEASYLTSQDPVLRAYWTDERARAWQTFWLFVWAAIAGLGFGMLLEAVRPFIEMIRLAR